MDASRAHPESYRLAVGICEAVTGEEDVEAAVEEHGDKVCGGNGGGKGGVWGRG